MSADLIGGRGSARSVGETIRDRILAGTYPARHHLGETEIAEDLNVSRTPVREALQRLAADGLVDLHPNRGAWVVEWTDEELREIYDLRVLLEGYGARLAALRMDSATLQRLEELEQEMESAAGGAVESRRARIAVLNTEFHLLILETSGDELLTSLASPLIRLVLNAMFRSSSEDGVRRSLSHHGELIAAFRVKDGEWAEAVMRAHLLAGRRNVRG